MQPFTFHAHGPLFLFFAVLNDVNCEELDGPVYLFSFILFIFSRGFIIRIFTIAASEQIYIFFKNF